MEKLTKEAEEILIERFGKDSIIALATTIDEIPYVRNVNAFYADGAFYVLTYGRKSDLYLDFRPCLCKNIQMESMQYCILSKVRYNL